MSAVLHVAENDSCLFAYLERRRCDHAASFDEAPKLSHSLAIELDEALNGEPLGQAIILSEVEHMEVMDACLSALGSPETATITARDFDADRLSGFLCSGSERPSVPTVTLINGEKVAGLQSQPDELQAVLDATACLADELEEHFEFRASGVAPRDDPAPIIYGGRAPDGCIVGVLCWP